MKYEERATHLFTYQGEEMLYYACLILCTLFLLSCKSDVSGTSAAQSISGTAVIDSKNGYVFSFERGGVEILNPPAQDSSADFEGYLETSPDGPEIIGLCFFGYSQEMFHLVRAFGTLDSARTFFENMSTITDTSFVISTCPLQEYNLSVRTEANQVWSIQTRQHKYAKILILSNQSYYSNTDSSYVELSFDWVYQPNGSRTF